MAQTTGGGGRGGLENEKGKGWIVRHGGVVDGALDLLIRSPEEERAFLPSPNLKKRGGAGTRSGTIRRSSPCG